MSRSFELLSDACAGLPHTPRKMFGGHGFFAPNGGMFAAIVTDDEVILKLADEAARTELIAAGGHPWVYEGKGQAMTMKEWIVVPDGFYDDPELFSAWAKRAHRLAPPKLATRKKPAVSKGLATAKKPAAKKAPRKPRR
ncbi:MAG: TfoX/Sxy family protein [Myxococcaceae bacterium]|jgi:DNA transformation protein|nr:TfoX/Sxy family protein [Myxococcaceae bacterium]